MILCVGQTTVIVHNGKVSFDLFLDGGRIYEQQLDTNFQISGLDCGFVDPTAK